jgi:FixJ family two-component response regulator
VTENNGGPTTESQVVFVIDDDLSVREAIEDLLRSVGLDVRTFGSTRDFLQSKPPDVPGCLVLDVRLPGSSGLEFQRALSDLGIHHPIIFISGYGDIPMSVRAIKAGAVAYLSCEEPPNNQRNAKPGSDRAPSPSGGQHRWTFHR